MKRLYIATAMFSVWVSQVSLAKDFLPLLYRARAVTVGKSTETVFVPEVFSRCDALDTKACILTAFEELKKQGDYGNTTISVETLDNRFTVLVSPDPQLDERSLAEIYLTCLSLGANQVLVGKDARKPLALSTITGVILAPFVNMQDALPPHYIPFGLVALKGGKVVFASDFYEGLTKKDSPVYEELLAMLRSQDAHDRLSALVAFSAMGMKDLSNIVLPMLEDPSPAVRLAVLKVLENDKRKEVLARVESRIENENDPMVKLACVRLLHSAGITKYDILLEAEGILEKPEGEVLKILEGKVLSAPPAIARSILASLVAHKSEKVAKKAVAMLLELKFYDDAVALLSSDPVPVQRREQIATLLLEAGKAVKAVFDFLVTNGNAENAMKAVTFVQKNKPEWGNEVLIKGVQRQEESVQLASIEGLVLYKDVSALQAIAEAASKSPKVNAVAKSSCIAIVGAQERKVVFALVKDKNPWVRECAIRTIENQIEKQVDEETLAILKDALKDEAKEVRLASASALAKTKRQDVLQTLASLWKESDPSLRFAAVVAAGSLSDKASEEAIISALSDTDTDVRKAGIMASKQRALKTAIEPLKNMVLSEGEEIAALALDALKAFAMDAMKSDPDFLVKALYSKHKTTRIGALDVCEGTTDRRVMNAVSALVSDREKEVRLKALHTLATTKSREAIEGIEKGAFDRDKEVRIYAIQALVELGRPEAIDFLREVIKAEEDEDLKKKAMEAIEKLTR
jgi:HEAT repeat protein